MLLKDKTAIVTGGGRGIGKDIALRLAREGADVAVFEIDPSTAEKTAKEIEALGRRALALKTDVSKSAEVNQSVQKVLDAWGKIDILVNNAAIVPKTLNADLSTWNPFLELTDEEWSRQIAVNLTGVFYCMRAVIKPMIAQKSGRVITISSIVGMTGGLFVTPSYTAAKAGVIGMTKLAARWLGKYGINFNTVNPIAVPTEGAVYGPEQLEGFAKAIPFRRGGIDSEFLCRPKDVSDAVVFLASDLSEFITGTSINVCGGHWMG